jgi:hypothetical protein
MSLPEKYVRGLAAIKAGLLVGVFVVAGIADANAQARGGGRGGGGGGRMAQSSVAGAGQAARGGGNRGGSYGNASGNRGNNVNSGNRGDVGSGNRVNNGNINTGDVNINRGDVNIDVDPGYGRVRYPVAAGMAIGAMAVTTAAVMGSYYYALPTGCMAVVINGITYDQCGSVYYQKTWQGNDVVYVVVQP